ncbi:hypothetical protein SAMN04488121_104339 [Chitinophaga filiformis]|uniref:Uncharacterized protein n=1 Tax=Chitinophaga filiformis TaxID=104663 RepID=A0A1G7UEJ9_CHIFI|nr:hypothetical protein SAMN04488121_104339 [Chitinophaga filiformis]
MIVQIYIDYWNFNKFFALFSLKIFYPVSIRAIKIPVAFNHRHLFLLQRVPKTTDDERSTYLYQ